MAEDPPPGGDVRSASNGAMLTSWKEIAAFFRRDVRTVQRWERLEGLPVHRHAHSRQSSVYAYPAELEAWWGRHPAPEPESLRRLHVPRPRVVVMLAVSLVAVALVAWGSVALRRTQTSSGFSVQRIGDGGGLPWVRSLADVTGDGLDDLVVHSAGGVDTGIYFGRSSGTVPAVADVRITMRVNAIVSAGVVGDVDGDGIGDLVVTAMLKDPDGFSATGPNYLLRGRRQWPSALELPRDADTVLSLDVANDARVGAYVEGRVDLNNDGLNDIVLGASDFCPLGRASAGGVFVLFGRRAWPARIELGADSDITFYGSRAGEGVGPFAAGDFNGDRVTDVLLMAGENRLWNMLGGRGRVYLLTGSGNWPRTIDLAAQTVAFIEGTVPGTRIVLSEPADFDGDGIDDVAFGVVNGEPPRGRVAVFMGRREISSRRSFEDADVILAGAKANNAFGAALRATDLNGDGRADLVVSDPLRGTIHAFLGRSPWPRRGDLSVYHPLDLVTGEVGTGASDLTFGDFDGDGAPEFAFAVIPSAYESNAPAWSGMVAPYLPLAVDIRPAHYPNAVLRSGVLVVGIDAARGTPLSDLDHASLRLAGTAPTEIVWRDFNNDGVADLQLYFDAARLPVSEATKRLALVGRTRQGVPVAGADDVTVVPLPRTSTR